MVDRRDADAADRADDVLVLLRLAVLLEPACDHADHGARVLLLEVEGLDVGVLQVIPLGVGAGAVDDREVDVRELSRDCAHRFLHQEADSDHEVVLLGREVREVRDVVIAALRLLDVALDLEIRLRLLEADVRQTDLVGLRRCASARGPTTGHGQNHCGGNHTKEPESLVRHPRCSLPAQKPSRSWAWIARSGGLYTCFLSQSGGENCVVEPARGHRTEARRRRAHARRDPAPARRLHPRRHPRLRPHEWCARNAHRMDEPTRLPSAGARRRRPLSVSRQRVGVPRRRRSSPMPRLAGGSRARAS